MTVWVKWPFWSWKNEGQSGEVTHSICITELVKRKTKDSNPSTLTHSLKLALSW